MQKLKMPVKEITDCIKKFLKKEFGDNIKSVILYGSYSRNEESNDSDIDLLIVVSDEVSVYSVRKKLGDIIFDIILEKSQLVEAMVVNESFFNNKNSPFLYNVKHEGIAVWKKNILL